MAMICLVIDTAGPYCGVALISRRSSSPASELPLAAESERIGRGHAERLMPMIESVLARAGCNYGELDRICVTTGPGSFTGVRIGISVARGLALALGVDAVGIGVLDVMGEQAARIGPDRQCTIVAALDAGRGELFLQAIKSADRTIVEPARRLSVDEARHWIGNLAGPVHLIGSAAPELFSSVSGGTMISETGHADIAVLAHMAAAGAGTPPPRPLYLRAPDAKPQTGKAVAHA